MPELLPYEPGSPDWLAARRAGVTATDIVTILGLSSQDSVYSLFWRKMGQVPEVPDSDRLRLGRELEDYVKQRWLESRWEDGRGYDLTIASGYRMPGGLYHHSDRAWQMATVDATVTDDIDESPLCGVLECKTWADADRRAWDNGPPAKVRAQVLWQIDTMDVAAGHVGVVFLPSGEFRSYEISHASTRYQPSCSICQDLKLMRAAGEEFMGRLRLELPPPDPDSSAASLAAVRARFTRQPGKTAEVDPDLWERYESSCVMIDAHKELKREREIKLREQAGEASVLTVDGQPVACRIITDAHVKAHVRHQDYLRRIKQEGDGDE